MSKRIVEVFSAGCPACEEAVELVKGLMCSSCDLQVLNMRSDRKAQAKARAYGIKKVPAVVVDGKLADCCQGGVEPGTLRALGVGKPQ